MLEQKEGLMVLVSEFFKRDNFKKDVGFKIYILETALMPIGSCHNEVLHPAGT